MATTQLAPRSEIAAAIADLAGLLGNRLVTSLSQREHHGHGESYHATRAPDAVAFPLDIEEVSAIVRICGRHDVPIIPFGAGTSLEGHVLAVRGGVCVDLSRMNAILAVNADDLDVTVQAGVTRKQLNAYLRDTGLFFPVDPGADATLGGMAATRASGTNAVRYGTMRENVVSLKVVLADGRVVTTSSRAKKSAAGYDLTRLLVGSEGTLGIIVEVTARLYGVPEAISTAISPFETVNDAIRTVIETIQFGIAVSKVEFIDEKTIGIINRFGGFSYAETPTLFFEFSGSEAQVAEQVQLVQAIAEGHGGKSWEWARDAEERARIWRARHDLGPATLALRPGAKIMGTDVCVPISALAECILETREDIENASFFINMLGHVGDGNFHLGLLIDPDDPAELAEAEAINARVVERAQRLGGTCTGEHGVGVGKIKYLAGEHGEGVNVMRAIKNALDPQGLFNPGKMLPDEDVVVHAI
jgi:D-lactate dehydrogenase (cytochrome)